jgi:hypothetical protein
LRVVVLHPQFSSFWLVDIFESVWEKAEKDIPLGGLLKGRDFFFSFSTRCAVDRELFFFLFYEGGGRKLIFGRLFAVPRTASSVLLGLLDVGG